MRRLLQVILLLLLSTLSLHAQNSVNEFISGFKDSGKLLYCSYSYTIKGQLSISSSGTAKVFGQMYHISTHGTESFCNGTTLWTVDRNAKEVIISAGDGPLLQGTLFGSLDALCDSVTDFSFLGSTLKLCAQDKEHDLVIVLTAQDIQFLPAPLGSSAFEFNTAELDSSWIITDLR